MGAPVAKALPVGAGSAGTVWRFDYPPLDAGSSHVTRKLLLQLLAQLIAMCELHVMGALQLLQHPFCKGAIQACCNLLLEKRFLFAYPALALKNVALGLGQMLQQHHVIHDPANDPQAQQVPTQAACRRDLTTQLEFMSRGAVAARRQSCTSTESAAEFEPALIMEL